MRYSGIGGQAVIEGVMMKNKDEYAVAVRTGDGSIVVEKKEYRGICGGSALARLPLARGVANFIDSLVLGISALNFSASFFEDGGGDPSDSKKERGAAALTVALSLALAVGVFMLLPYWLSTFFERLGWGYTAIAAMEGLIRVAIFLAYIGGISLMDDIRRVYMYHGAEHKCINCIEQGMDLTVENVRKCSRLHRRCGTSFLFFVIIVSVVLFMFIRVPSRLMRILARLALVPVIAGVSYELLRLAGRSDGKLIGLISKPGMILQHLTTREPDDSMIEVGIASVEAVFDWRSFVAGRRADDLSAI